MFCCLLTIIIIIYLFIARRIYKSLNKNAASVLVTVWPWCAAWEKGCHSFSYYAGSESLYNLNWVGGWFHRNIQLMHCWKFVFHVFSFYLTGMQVPGFSLSRLVAHSIYVCPFLSESSHPWLTIAQLAEHLTVVQTSEIRVSLVRFRVVREICQIEMDVKTPFFFLFVVFPGDTAETAFFFSGAESWQCAERVGVLEKVRLVLAWLGKSLRVVAGSHWQSVCDGISDDPDQVAGLPSAPDTCSPGPPSHTGPGSLSPANLELLILIIFMMPIIFISLLLEIPIYLFQVWLQVFQVI